MIILVTIFWFFVILPYILLQTSYGAKFASGMLSKYTLYHIHFDSFSHSIIKPYELTFENITIQSKNEPQPLIKTKKLTIGLDHRHLMQFSSFDYLYLENGQTKLAHSPASQYSFNQLYVNNIDVDYLLPENNTTLVLQGVRGKILATQSESNQQKSYQFMFTARQLSYDQLMAKSVVLKGITTNNSLELTDFGGHIGQGDFIAKFAILPNQSLEINQFSANHIDSDNINDFLLKNQIIDTFKVINIHHLTLFNSHLEQENLAIEQGNLEINNLTYQNGQWNLSQSDLNFSANNMIVYGELIEDPLLKWHYQDDQIIIEDLLAKWNNSHIHSSGTFKQSHLIMNNLLATGFRYQLPPSWQSQLSSLKLPSFISDVTIQSLTMMPSIIIDTNPDLPFQFSGFELLGNKLSIQTSENREQITLKGTLTLKADDGSLNTVPLQYPDLNIDFAPDASTLSFSALIDEGVLEGEATVTSSQISSFRLDGNKINTQLLSKWKLVHNPISSDNFSLTLSGKLDPLTVRGQLISHGTSYSINNNQLQQ